MGESGGINTGGPAQAPPPFDAVAPGTLLHAPMPLPASPPGGPRRRGGAIAAGVAAGVVTLLCACCVVPAVLAPLLGRALGPALKDPLDRPIVRRSLAPLEATWAFHGEFALVQSSKADGTARVVVWERRTGRRRVFDGFRAVVSEEVTPVVWLVRDSLDTSPDLYGRQGPRGEWDTGTAELYELTLADTTPVPTPLVSAPSAPPMPAVYGPAAAGLAAVPLAAVPSTALPDGVRLAARPSWPPWPSRQGPVAQLRVHAALTSFPDYLFFTGPVTSTDAIVTGDSMRPLGWSPSGRYFGVVHLAQTTASNPVVGVELADPSTLAGIPWYLKISHGDDHVFDVAWDPVADRVWWFGRLTGDRATMTRFRTIGPTGRLTAQPLTRTAEPAVLRDADGYFCGTSPAGPVLFTDDGRLWVRKPDSLVELGRLTASVTGSAAGAVPASGADFDARAGVLWTVMVPMPGGTFEKVVYASAPDGTDRTVVWSEVAPNPVLGLLGRPSS